VTFAKYIERITAIIAIFKHFKPLTIELSISSMRENYHLGEKVASIARDLFMGESPLDHKREKS
jgi:hypothetical protein